VRNYSRVKFQDISHSMDFTLRLCVLQECETQSWCIGLSVSSIMYILEKQRHWSGECG